MVADATLFHLGYFTSPKILIHQRQKLYLRILMVVYYESKTEGKIEHDILENAFLTGSIDNSRGVGSWLGLAKLDQPKIPNILVKNSSDISTTQRFCL